jgi:triacylglycerol lipase
MMVVAAELDPPGFVQQFELLKQASCKRASGCSRAVMLRQHSHTHLLQFDLLSN